MVVFAIAAMGLNILVGNTNLVSFGHGAWFGLAAYAAALSQRHWFPGDIVLPALFAVGMGPNQFFNNDNKDRDIFLLAALDQGWWPDGATLNPQP